MSDPKCIHQQQMDYLAARSNAAMRRGSVADTTALAILGERLTAECAEQCGSPKSSSGPQPVA